MVFLGVPIFILSHWYILDLSYLMLILMLASTKFGQIQCEQNAHRSNHSALVLENWYREIYPWPTPSLGLGLGSGLGLARLEIRLVLLFRVSTSFSFSSAHSHPPKVLDPPPILPAHWLPVVPPHMSSSTWGSKALLLRLQLLAFFREYSHAGRTTGQQRETKKKKHEKHSMT